jgi:uncharacterized protein
MCDTTHEKHLVVFARYPMLGAGKRRLAKGVGAVTAVRFQRTGLAHLLWRVGSDTRWTTWIAATPNGSGPWPAHINIIDQGRGDLGQRLQRVVDALPPGRVVIVGSDIPGITAGLIAKAFTKLAGHEAVFGPASDGGYWLVGLSGTGRRRKPFHDVRWSTHHALADTALAFQPHKIARIAVLRDVDEASDLDGTSWQRLIRA